MYENEKDTHKNGHAPTLKRSVGAGFRAKIVCGYLLEGSVSGL
jgi:hypothetical protein